LGNIVNSDFSAIGGGESNEVSSGYSHATIGGGENSIVTANNGTVAGGRENTVIGTHGAIGGGGQNEANAQYATVGGGLGNEANGAPWGATTVGGGQNNEAIGGWSTVGGGAQNTASGTTGYATVGGGASNDATGDYSTVGGGESNLAGTGTHSTVGGGQSNQALGNHDTVAGGQANIVNSNHSAIGGGDTNVVNSLSQWSTIGGGQNNTAGIGTHNTVGGGEVNEAGSAGSHNTVGGGFDNHALGNYDTVAGGQANVVWSDSGFIGGGQGNTINTGSQWSTIGGGRLNAIQPGGTNATVGGGWGNTAGGQGAAVGGGQSNTAVGLGATVPGGESNQAMANWSFAAGQQAQAVNQGTFVWADSQPAPFISTGPDQFLIRAQGGVGIGANTIPAGIQLYVAGDAQLGDGNTMYVDNVSSLGDPLRLQTDDTTRVFVRDTDGYVGINTSTPDRRLDVEDSANPQLRLTQSSQTTFADFHMNSSGNLEISVDNQTDQLVLTNDGKVGIGTSSPGPTATLDVSGTARVNVLHIDGGADLAEPFEIVGRENVEPGMVVCIDPKNPGQLRIADKGYDRMVAGIVSGANGLNPGITMQQGGVLAGSFPVALSGRVYGLADASYGAIQPGDMLTTSDTPGHVRKVTDYDKAHGAIVGKAMTALDEGQGLVLILVMPH
jgi:hypothetical protein